MLAAVAEMERDLLAKCTRKQDVRQAVENDRVSLPWKGHGSAIFLEPGNLAPLSDLGRGTNVVTLQCMSVGTGASKKVLGYFTAAQIAAPQIEDGLNGRLSATVNDIAIQGPVPELLIEFSNGQRLISAAMCTDVSDWDI